MSQRATEARGCCRLSVRGVWLRGGGSGPVVAIGAARRAVFAAYYGCVYATTNGRVDWYGSDS